MTILKLPFPCPSCSDNNCIVTKCRALPDGKYRRERTCKDCGQKFITTQGGKLNDKETFLRLVNPNGTNFEKETITYTQQEDAYYMLVYALEQIRKEDWLKVARKVKKKLKIR